MEQMIVNIKNGSVEIEIEGARGARCVELTQAIEKLIGEVETRFLKQEFYQNTKVNQDVSVKDRLGEIDNL